MQGITRHSCQEEVTEMEDKLINRALVGEEFPIFFFFCIYQYLEQRGGTGRSNLDFFSELLKAMIC